jgi:hypothetical protein
MGTLWGLVSGKISGLGDISEAAVSCGGGFGVACGRFRLLLNTLFDWMCRQKAGWITPNGVIAIG